MLRRRTPEAWRTGYALHRRRQETDCYGEKKDWYDMENPDVLVELGSEDAVCWQDVKTWQTAGKLSTGGSVAEEGERNKTVLQGVLYSGLEVKAFDRFMIDGQVFELRKIQQWPGHRLLQLEQVF